MLHFLFLSFCTVRDKIQPFQSLRNLVKHHPCVFEFFKVSNHMLLLKKTNINE